VAFLILDVFVVLVAHHVNAYGIDLGLALLEALESHSGVAMEPFKNLAATEWFDESRHELMMGDHQPGCIFTDISEFYHKSVLVELQHILDKGGKLDFATLQPVLKSAMSVTDTAFCVRHQRRCVHPTADVHIAGTPCPDYSILGKGEGCDGPTMVYYCAWAAMRRRLGEPIIIQENVPEQPLSLLQESLGDLYHIQEILLCPSQFGWPVRRRRLWRVMTHRAKCDMPMQPLDVLHKFFTRRCGISWRDLLVALPEEIQSEVLWASQRPLSRAYHKSDDEKASLLPVQSLTENEFSAMQVYKRIAPGCVWNLGQNPRKVPISSDPDVLGTVVKHCGIMFADHPAAPVTNNHKGRWFCPREVLLTQGIPAYDSVLEMRQVRRKICSFNIERAGAGFPERYS
jgi:site-specific DNA-cytosine methylase